MNAPFKFPVGSDFAMNESGDEYVKLPSGKVFLLAEEQGKFIEVRRFPLMGNFITEETFLKSVRDCGADLGVLAEPAALSSSQVPT